MTVSANVYLGDRFVATLTNLSGDYNLLSFEESYLDDSDRPTLSQAFVGAAGPVRGVPRTHRVAPPFLANLLPEEGSLLRNVVARQYGINATRDFPYLQALGSDLPGAISIEAVVASIEPAGFEVVPLANESVRFSLAGMQPKFSASMSGDRLSLPINGIGGEWIAKLPTNAYARLPENEALVMTMAAEIGLPVPRIDTISLDRIDGVPTSLPALRADEPRIAYVIKRFDRSDGGRIHVEDFNQVANQKPDEKYDRRTSAWIARVIATICPPDDLDDYVRRLVFGVCVGNNDMHLKNWAVRYPDGRNARLAPLYDYVCTRAYFPSGELALTIGGERRFERIGARAIEAFARDAEISTRSTQALAREVVDALRGVWPAFRDRAESIGLRDVLERHFDIVPLMNGGLSD